MQRACEDTVMHSFTYSFLQSRGATGQIVGNKSDKGNLHVWKATDVDVSFRLQALKEREKCEHQRERLLFLHEGRLGTSNKQGNHDNHTTNLGNQLSVLTVGARQAAQQGLI